MLEYTFYRKKVYSRKNKERTWKKEAIKKKNNPIKKWGTEFSTEETQVAEKQLKKCSTSLAIREMKIKTTLKFHLTPVRRAKIKSTSDSSCWRDAEQGEPPPLLVQVQTCSATLEINMTVSQKIGNQSTSRLSYAAPGHIPKGCSILSQGHLLNYVHSSFIHTSLNLETT